jgi:ribulose-phosphate 3-epimerase
MQQLAPSILAADFNRLGEEIKAVERAGVQMLHVDVMDGLFVPSISFGMPVLKSIRKESTLLFDVHLMIQEPERYIRDFQQSGADSLTVHAEACKDPGQVLRQIHEAGMKAGLAVNPETPVEQLYPYVGETELFLIMTVHPGFGGQKFIPETVPKIQALAAFLKEKGHKADIQVDGGIYLENVDVPLSAGANVIVAGTAVFRGDTEANAKRFLEALR